MTASHLYTSLLPPPVQNDAKLPNVSFVGAVRSCEGGQIGKEIVAAAVGLEVGAGVGSAVGLGVVGAAVGGCDE